MAPQAVLSLALSNPSTEDTEIFRNKHSKALRWKAQPSGLIYVGVLAKEIAFPSKETVAGSYPRAFRPTQTHCSRPVPPASHWGARSLSVLKA